MNPFRHVLDKSEEGAQRDSADNVDTEMVPSPNDNERVFGLYIDNNNNKNVRMSEKMSERLTSDLFTIE